MESCDLQLFSWHGIVDELHKFLKGSIAISSQEKQIPMTMVLSSMPLVHMGLILIGYA
jgi:hypothetical protein